VTKQWTSKWPYIVNPVFWIVQNHDEKSYFRRFRGKITPISPLDPPLNKSLAELILKHLTILIMTPAKFQTSGNVWNSCRLFSNPVYVQWTNTALGYLFARTPPSFPGTRLFGLAVSVWGHFSQTMKSCRNLTRSHFNANILKSTRTFIKRKTTNTIQDPTVNQHQHMIFIIISKKIKWLSAFCK